jgi:hypothetical protein
LPLQSPLQQSLATAHEAPSLRQLPPPLAPLLLLLPPLPLPLVPLDPGPKTSGERLASPWIPPLLELAVESAPASVSVALFAPQAPNTPASAGHDRRPTMHGKMDRTARRAAFMVRRPKHVSFLVRK